MQITAERLYHVKASASEAVSRRARELLAADVDIISLSTDEPDFDTLKHMIKAAAIKPMRCGQTRYTSSDRALAAQSGLRPVGQFPDFRCDVYGASRHACRRMVFAFAKLTSVDRQLT